jgi:hypothetical protein
MRKSLALLLVLVACSSSKQKAVAPSPTVDAGADDAGLPDASVDLEAGTADGGVDDDGGGLAAPAFPAEALDLAIDTAVTAQAAKLAPKMSLEGQPLHATLNQGERANMVVTMAPGKCYTFIALSPPGQIQDLDLKLMAPPFYNVEAGSSAKGDKNPAVIGKGKAPQCPVSPIAVPYRIDAVAAQGAGRVGVFVYSRSK